jgi:hypothetical protein
VVDVSLQQVDLVVDLVDPDLRRVLLARQHAEPHSLVRHGLRGRHDELFEGLLFLGQVPRGVLDVLLEGDVAAA